MKVMQHLFLLFLILSPLYYAPLAWTYNPQSPDYTLYRAGKDVAMLVLMLAWAVALSTRRSGLPAPPRLLVMLVVCHAIALSIASLGIGHEYAVDVNFAVRTLVPLGLFFLAVDLLRTESSRRAALSALVGVGALIAVVALAEWGLRPEPSVYTWAAGGQFRAVGTLVNPLSLGWYLAFIAALVAGARASPSASRAPEAPWWSRRPAAYLLLGLLLAGIVASGTRSAIVAFALVVALSAGLRWPRLLARATVSRRGLVSMAMALVVATTAIALAGILVLNGMVETGLEQPLRVLRGAETTRWTVYASLVDEMSRRPLPEMLFGLSHETLVRLDQRRLNTDSYLLLLLTQGGIATFSTWLLTVVAAIWAALHAPRGAAPLGGAIAFGIGALAAMSAIGNVLYLFPHGAVFWVLIGMSVGGPSGHDARREHAAAPSPGSGVRPP